MPNDKEVSVGASAKADLEGMEKFLDTLKKTSEELISMREAAVELGRFAPGAITAFTQSATNLTRQLEQNAAHRERNEENRERRKISRQRIIEAAMTRFGSTAIMPKLNIPVNAPPAVRAVLEEEAKEKAFRTSMAKFREEYGEGEGGMGTGGLLSTLAGAVGFPGVGRIIRAIPGGGWTITVLTLGMSKFAGAAREAASSMEMLDRQMRRIEIRAEKPRRFFDNLGRPFGLSIRDSLSLAEIFGAQAGTYSRADLERVMAIQGAERLDPRLVGTLSGQLKRLGLFSDRNWTRLLTSAAQMGFVGERTDAYINQILSALPEIIRYGGGRDNATLMRVLGGTVNLPMRMMGGGLRGELLAGPFRSQMERFMRSEDPASIVFLRRALSRSQPGMMFSEFDTRRYSPEFFEQNIRDVIAQLRADTSALPGGREVLYQVLKARGFSPDVIGQLMPALLGQISVDEIIRKSLIPETGAKDFKGIAGAQISDTERRMLDEEYIKFRSFLKGAGQAAQEFSETITNARRRIQDEMEEITEENENYVEAFWRNLRPFLPSGFTFPVK